jgi:DNA-binding MarR family transcriptional regulator
MATRKSVGPETPPFRTVAFMLSSLGYAVSRGFHDALAPLGLEPGEFALLRAVGASGGEAQSALAERLRISPSWMVAIVDQLENRGLLERRPHERDRRVRNLHLTAAGKRLLKRAQQLAAEFDLKVAKPLSEAEQRELVELLATVSSALDLEPGAAHAALSERR